jgi:ATP-binding cassette, subfamily F, member 2
MDFQFPSPGPLAPPVLQCTDIAFGYPGEFLSPIPSFYSIHDLYTPLGCPILYHGVDFGVDLDSRVALVGPNGAGTLISLTLSVPLV